MKKGDAPGRAGISAAGFGIKILAKAAEIPALPGLFFSTLRGWRKVIGKIDSFAPECNASNARFIFYM